MIIDTHTHLGASPFSGVAITPADLLGAMDAHGVHISLTMPQPWDADAPAAHDTIAALAAAHPGRVYGICLMRPTAPDFAAEARRCVRDLGFVALKLHPFAHHVSPYSDLGQRVFRTAADLGVPLIVHTGQGLPFALPSLCIPAALRHPDLVVVLAHAGHAIYTEEALVAAEVCPNIVLEPSWCGAYQLRHMVDRFGPDRVILGSDHPTNLPVELAKFRSVLNPAELHTCLHTTPHRLFRLPHPTHEAP